MFLNGRIPKKSVVLAIIIEKYSLPVIHVRMGLKPHATYGEKDAKAPSTSFSTLSISYLLLIILKKNVSTSFVSMPPEDALASFSPYVAWGFSP